MKAVSKSGKGVTNFGANMAKLMFVAAALTSPFAYADTANTASEIAARCSTDLEDIAQFLPVNDSGASAELAQHGAAIDVALVKARADMAHVLDEAGCNTLVQTYLSAWRPGHLYLVPTVARAGGSPSPLATMAAIKPDVGKVANDPRAPTLQVLDSHTILLTLRSFNAQYHDQLEALFKQRRSDLVRHSNWIIDVRDNDGGDDASWQPLMPWLLSGELLIQNVEWYVTPANLQAQEDICRNHPEVPSCVERFEPIVQGMRDAKPGTYALTKGTSATMYQHISKPEAHAPSRVAVLVDHPCGSSCDQFLLAVRESYRVKLIGRPSFGVLDYSNLRPHPLPSGQRSVLYATTRSTRLPAYPIDQIGVQPDVFLSPPIDDAGKRAEVERVRRWMEGGSLKPD